MKHLNSLMETVTTFDGTPALRKDCRFIKGNYYIKDKQCFLIDDRWYRINSGYVVYDHEYAVWKLKSDDIYTGAVGVNDDGGIMEGHFSPNPEKNVHIYYGGNVQHAISTDIFEGHSNIREGLNGCYYFITDKRIPPDFTTKIRPHKEGFYSFPFNYGSEPLIPEFLEVFRKEFVGNDLLSDAAKYIKGYSFGIEFETDKGAIPERHLKRNGLIACKDGSIAGFEYATVPLCGDVGVQAIKVQCELLRKYCSCSLNESLHIHVGGYPRTIKALTALFRLGQKIEREIYAMFPYYYVDTSTFKRKSYCSPLPHVGVNNSTPLEIFSELFFWLSNNTTKFRKSFPTGPHPMDRSGQHKWEISPRYIWLNMIPLIWGGRGTVEFRCHTPTFSTPKVINWLFIVIAILKYARKHTAELISKPFKGLAPVTLKSIIEEAYPKKISGVLLKYVEDRTTHYSCKNDNTGEEEIGHEMSNCEILNLIEFV